MDPLPPFGRPRGGANGDYGANRGRGAQAERGRGARGGRGRGAGGDWGHRGARDDQGRGGRFRGHHEAGNLNGRGNRRGRGCGNEHGRGRRPHRGMFEDSIPPMGFGRMKRLLDKDDGEILQGLAQRCDGFKEELDATQPNEDKERFALPLLLIKRAFSTDKFPTALAQLMVSIRDTNWFSRLPIFLQNIRIFNRQDIEYIENVLYILKIFLSKMPSSLDVVNQVLLTLEYLCKVRDMPPGVKLSIEPKITDLQRSTEEMEKRKEEQKIADDYNEEDFLKPPDDFLTISILPSEDDLVRAEKPFLRMNKSHGRYMDLAHYLDVQFRLLRADFVAPLQNGIQTYLQNKDQPVPRKGPAQDIRLYENVHVIGPVCHRDGVAYRIQFDTKKFPNVRWETTKRFIFGSLLCLTADNFESVFFGTVAHRDAKDLSQGQLDLYIEGDCEAFLELDYSEPLLMVESMAFFGAYRPVLDGLKNVLDTGLAMSSYIVECDMTPKPPSYLRDNSTRYDMRCLVADDRSRQWSQVPVLQREMWPTADDLGLDCSQYKALHTALTQEFALIQGPPGTGKTFLGLKIAKVLLKNSQDILAIHQKPMMVVCYTNHALDQFLEGIHEFESDGILRIGGRCKSEILENCRLHIVRKKYMELKIVGNDYRRAAAALHGEMEEASDYIEECTAITDLLTKRIMYTFHLSEVMKDQHKEQLLSIHVPPKYAVMEWLGHGHTVSYRPPDVNEEAEEDIEEFVNAEEEVDIVNMMRELDIEDVNFNQRAADAKKSRFKSRALLQLGLASENEDDAFNNTGGWEISADEKRQRKKVLRRRLMSGTAMSEDEANAIKDVTRLPMNERWRLYHYWLKQFRRGLREKTQRMAREYQNASQRLQEIHGNTDLEVMKHMKVIGMTTTGAARYQHIIQQLAPPIVIIEEAAEVLEAHVVTSLNPHCKHLILIGDHKQLRPSATVFELAYKYHLDLSLFERMINNGLQCVTLSTQHRMRPEISVLVRPIYPELKDHDSVLKYPVVRGVKHSLYLIDHQHNESHNEELVSKMNPHEAKYISRLCCYLMQQGYDPEQITVLTPYSGQMTLIRKQMPKQRFDGVRICVLDNYQGEENDIILLSLVRSNKDGKLGFLGIENRICVALSRAKIGFYIIGDFTMFEGNNDIWADILKRVAKYRGPALPLYCPNHPKNEGTNAMTDKDFNQVPEGGCSLPCEYRMECGHTCPLVCHGYDREHRNIKCTKPCPKILCSSGHKCRKLCSQKCGDCLEKVSKYVPDCKNSTKHCIRVACSKDLTGFKCSAPCEHRLSCGHVCSKSCGSPHTAYCLVMVDKTLPCGHRDKIACDQDASLATCRVTCEHKMSCEHPCAGDCSRCMQGKMHIGCRKLCSRPLVCNHQCGNYCCSSCPPCQLPCETRCVHNQCPKPCGEPCIPCMEPCAWVCKHFQCTQPCSSPCDRPPCNRRCRKLLKCRHQCVGVCGETCPPLCRNCNRQQLCEIFFGTEDEEDALFVYLEDCGHVFEMSGLDQWVITSCDDQEAAIQPILCPRCKTAIRKNLRYGKAVNASVKDIQMVKQKAFDEQATFHKKRLEIISQSHYIDESNLSMQWQHVIDNLTKGKKPVSSQACANVITLLNTLTAVKKFSTKVKVKLHCSVYQMDCVGQLKSLTSWLQDCPGRFHSEVDVQLEAEWKRLNLLVKFCDLEMHRKTCGRPEMLSMLDKSLRKLVVGNPLAEGHADALEALYTKIKSTFSGLAITEEERLSIVKAMGLAQGHWFKCPNGHPYVITECGGAMVVSKCPECKEDIGGTSHTLLPTNRLAREMDGAGHPAWSDQANMGNYQLPPWE